jgi:hypothetical protein
MLVQMQLQLLVQFSTVQRLKTTAEQRLLPARGQSRVVRLV